MYSCLRPLQAPLAVCLSISLAAAPVWANPPIQPAGTNPRPLTPGARLCPQRSTDRSARAARTKLLALQAHPDEQGVLYGQVVAPRGRPVSDTTVSFLHNDHVAARAVSDAEGRFTVRGLTADTYQVSALSGAGGFVGPVVVHPATASAERAELQVPLVPPHALLPMASGSVEAGPSEVRAPDACSICGQSPCMMEQYGTCCGEMGFEEGFGNGGGFGGGFGGFGGLGLLGLAGAAAAAAASGGGGGGGGGGGKCCPKQAATPCDP